MKFAMLFRERRPGIAIGILSVAVHSLRRSGRASVTDGARLPCLPSLFVTDLVKPLYYYGEEASLGIECQLVAQVRRQVANDRCFRWAALDVSIRSTLLRRFGIAWRFCRKLERLASISEGIV